MKTRPYKKYSNEYKEMAVVKAQELGNATQTAKELGISLGTLNTWIRVKKALPSNKPFKQSLDESDEIRRLKKQLAEAKMENEIIKKAVAYFAKDQLPPSTP